MAKKIMIAFLFSTFITQSWAQNIEDSKEPEKVATVNSITQGPIFPGCEEEPDKEAMFKCMNIGIMRVIAKNFQYPDEAKEKRFEDKVWVSFVIDKSGDITDVELVKGEYESLNQEAIRVIKKLPKMIPAEIEGEPVKMSYTVPINFSLN